MFTVIDRESELMRDPDELLSRAGVRGDPDADQHFLIDNRVLDRIPTYLTDCLTEIDDPTILEIGSGNGALTDRLLSVGERVIAIEQDKTLTEFLQREFRNEINEDRLSVINGDATTIEFPPFDISISNLPYSVSSHILFRLLPTQRPLLLMFQQEFAERMVALPGTPEYGRLSVTSQYYANIEIVERVPKTAFSPQPAVSSALVRLYPKQPEYDVGDEEFYFRFVKGMFTQRRKTLRNGIRNTTHITGISDSKTLIETLEDELCQKRPDAVTPKEFAHIATTAITLGVYSLPSEA